MICTFKDREKCFYYELHGEEECDWGESSTVSPLCNYTFPVVDEVEYWRLKGELIEK